MSVASPPRRILLAALVLTLLSVLALSARADAAPVPLTVDIQRFIEVQNPDPAVGQGCCGDYYAKVSIGGQPSQTSGEIDDQADITPFWRFTRTVDDSQSSVPVVIQIFDADTALAAPDDIMDLNPVDGAQELHLQVDPRTGRWSGDVPQDVGFSQGDGDHEQHGLTEGGEAGKVLFDISLSNDGDIDDDGIPDAVERFGVRNANGDVVADMAALGADPCRKSIAIEADWMADATHSHRPTDAAVADAVAAMNGAPVAAVPNCPYAGFPARPSGVNLVIDRSNQVPEQATFPLGSLAGLRDAGNFDPARRPYFHYVLFAHDQATGNSSSGVCCSNNKDYLVTLGSWANNVGTDRDQAGTILHELGHSLGLGHGGDSGTNYKPNYLSVMNYSFDPTGIPDPTIPANIDTDGNGTPDQSFRLDYSRSALPAVQESSLQEATGFGGGTDNTLFYGPDYKTHAAASSGAVDLDRNGASTDTNVKQDLNRDYCVDAGKDGTMNSTPAGDDAVINGWITAGPDFVCNTTAAGDDVQNTATGTNVLSQLTGWDDWSTIKYRAALSVDAGGAAAEHGPDMTYDEARAIKSATFAEYRPDLTTTKSVDHADAQPGDTLAYTVTAHNEGTGDAAAVRITDTLPGGGTPSRDVGALAAGASHAEGFSYLVPCTAADGDHVVNRATVSGTNLLNNPEVRTDNNGSSATTTVHAPVLTLGVTATPSVQAGEAITYRLRYADTGSADASGVRVTAALPVGVYYSTPLDLGAGPRPASVVRHADGTTTLTWQVGDVAAGGDHVIEFTARPTLLSTAGDAYTTDARLTFANSNGCTYAPVDDDATTTIAAVTPTRDPLSQGYFRNHEDQWSDEMEARIQATDQRFDGADGTTPDGALSDAEVAAVLRHQGTAPANLRSQLLAALFNLATRRIEAAVTITSPTADRLGLDTVAEGVRYGAATLDLPYDANRARYGDAIRVLDEVNLNRSERY